MKMIKAVLVLGTVAILSACDSSSSSGGDDKVATQCLAFGTAVKLEGGYRHKVINTCDKKINALEASTEQRLVLDKGEQQDVVMFSATPSMGACFFPFFPVLITEGDDEGLFKCRKDK